MEFKILGSFEVSDGGRPVDLGGYKQRAALAVLVLSANRVMTTDRLVDDLWGEDPPRQATGSLQAYISNLRRALEPGRAPRESPRVLRSQAGGYVLAIDLAAVDAARFEHHASEGRTLLRQGRFQAAREALAEALELWRGPALVEFADEPFARSEAARLEELREAALEDRITADLALGDHPAVVAEVQRLVAKEPLREQLWAHLMLALYRSGRQADALAAYQHCRRTLGEELGIDPGPALRKLQSDVLQQAPSLDWQPPGAEGARGGAPTSGARGLACLLFRDGSGRPHVYPLEERESRLIVGRASTADVWLSWDVKVSRRHAELEWAQGEWAVIDDGMSSNGSFVNDQPIHGRRVLADGDELRFADTALTFRLPGQSAAVETFLGE